MISNSDSKLLNDTRITAVSTQSAMSSDKASISPPGSPTNKPKSTVLACRWREDLSFSGLSFHIPLPA